LAAGEEGWIEFLLLYAWMSKVRGRRNFQRSAVAEVHLRAAAGRWSTDPLAEKPSNHAGSSPASFVSSRRSALAQRCRSRVPPAPEINLRYALSELSPFGPRRSVALKGRMVALDYATPAWEADNPISACGN
jgi:hypothetical protein